MKIHIEIDSVRDRSVLEKLSVFLGDAVVTDAPEGEPLSPFGDPLSPPVKTKEDEKIDAMREEALCPDDHWTAAQAIGEESAEDQLTHGQSVTKVELVPKKDTPGEVELVGTPIPVKDTLVSVEVVALRAELSKRGVAFRSTASAKTLQGKLDADNAKRVMLAEPETVKPETPVGADNTEEKVFSEKPKAKGSQPTKEEVRNVMIQVGTAWGNDEVFRILKEFGADAKSISEIPGDLYGAVTQAASSFLVDKRGSLETLLKKRVSMYGGKSAIALMRKHGGESIIKFSDLDPKHYMAVAAGCGKMAVAAGCGKEV